MAETLETAESAADRLIDRARAGDRAAFDQIVAEYQRRVASTAWRMLGDREDARDAAQETFLKVFKYIGSFRIGEDFGAWIYRIVVNVCRDVMKKRSRRWQAISLDDIADSRHFESLTGPQDLEADAIVSEQRKLVGMALETLTRKEREALVLRDLEGLSTEEVARILGSSQGTVRSQICSARAKIKQYRDRMLKPRRSL
jgi:RNA polymerase sigma-70 factor (ECF subfamily)